MKQFTLFLFFIICITRAKAQFMPMTSTFYTGAGPIHATHYVYMPYNYGYGGYSPKYEFTVRLKNDSVVSFKSKIEVDKKRMYVVYKDKKEKVKVFPSDTKTLTGINEYKTESTGVPADSCWLFLVKMGAIKCYSSMPTLQMTFTIAVQKGNDGEIISLTKEHLKDMISDEEDEKLSKWMKKGDLVKVIERYNKIKIGIKK